MAETRAELSPSVRRLYEAPNALPAGQCRHRDVHINAENVGLNDSNINILRVTARCKECGKQMVFRGMPDTGMSLTHPVTWENGKEARLPFLAEGEAFIDRIKPDAKDGKRAG